MFMGITPEIKIKSPFEELMPRENLFQKKININKAQKLFLHTMLPFELIIK